MFDIFTIPVTICIINPVKSISMSISIILYEVNLVSAVVCF